MLYNGANKYFVSKISEKFLINSNLNLKFAVYTVYFFNLITFNNFINRFLGMKRIFLLCAFAITLNLVVGQDCVPTLEDYQKFLKSKTYVVFDETLMSDFNVKIKEIMERSWSITPVEYIDSKEFDKMKNDSDASFIVNNNVTFYKDKAKGTYRFISLLMGNPDTKITNLPDLCSLPLAYIEIDQEEYSYKFEAFVQFMQTHVRNVLADPSLIGENVLRKYNKEKGRFSTKTLYLLKKEVVAEANDVTKIKKFYPFAVKFVTQEEIEDAIIRQDKDVVFLHMVGPKKFRHETRVYKVIVGAGDQKLYYFDWQILKSAKDIALQTSDLKKMSK